MQFWELPTEIIFKILSNLNPSNLVAVLSTCKQLNNLYPDTAIWRELFSRYGLNPTDEVGATLLQKFMVTHLVKTGKDYYEVGDIAFGKQCFKNAEVHLDSFPTTILGREEIWELAHQIAEQIAEGEMNPGDELEPIPWTHNEKKNLKDQEWYNLIQGWQIKTRPADEPIPHNITTTFNIGNESANQIEKKLPRLFKAMELLRDSNCPIGAVALLKPFGQIWACIQSLKDIVGIQTPLVRNTVYHLVPNRPRGLREGPLALRILNNYTDDFDENDLKKLFQEKLAIAIQYEEQTADDFFRFYLGIHFALATNLLTPTKKFYTKIFNIIEKAAESGSNPKCLVFLGYCYCFRNKSTAPNLLRLEQYNDLVLLTIMETIPPLKFEEQGLITEDFNKARAYFKRALEANCAEAIDPLTELTSLEIVNAETRQAKAREFFHFEMTQLANKTKNPMTALLLSKLFGGLVYEFLPYYYEEDNKEQAKYWQERALSWLLQQVQLGHTKDMPVICDKLMKADLISVFNILTLAQEKSDPRASDLMRRIFINVGKFEGLMILVAQYQVGRHDLNMLRAFCEEVSENLRGSYHLVPNAEALIKQWEHLSKSDKYTKEELTAAIAATKAFIEDFKAAIAPGEKKSFLK